ncbi:hypothetical protein ABE527_14315 [Brucella sp. TWI432]
MSYDHLLDYLGDLRAAEAPETPPGGSTGNKIADEQLCIYAYRAKTHQAPIAYIRDIGAQLAHRSTPNSWQEVALVRIAAWSVEHQESKSHD